jgi:hypothetical protein
MKNFFEKLKNFFGGTEISEPSKNETIVEVKPQVTEKKTSAKPSKSKKKTTEEVPTITLDTVTITASKISSTSNDTDVRGPEHQ